MNTFKLAGRPISSGEPCFIIAEAGVNHNGDLGLALGLVDAAYQAGADAVKFQTWITEKLVTPDTPMAEYQQQNIGLDASQFEMLKKLELQPEQFRDIKRYADQKGILFLSTPDEEDSADFLEQLEVAAFKIGSGEVTNLPFLKHLAEKRKPLILSTGMSTLGEVERAMDVIKSAGNSHCALLHCVSAYPTSPEECNLRAMDTLSAAFACPVGFSDHTLGTEVAVAAVARGACILEKHLTLDKCMAGPDHSASLNPDEFREFVRVIRTVEQALGDGRKQPMPSEMETKRVVQKVIVAGRDLHSGELITLADLTLRRSSGGLGAVFLPVLVGRRVSRAVKTNSPLTWDLLQ